MRPAPITEEELVYALEFCGIAPARDPKDISKEAIGRLIEVMKTPILRDTPDLVIPSTKDLLNIPGLAKKEKVPQKITDHQSTVRFVFAANFSSVALFAATQDQAKHKHFKTQETVDALVYLITNGQPFGQFYAIQTLIALLSSPDSKMAEFITNACLKSHLLAAIIDCTNGLNYDWQLDAPAALIEILFNNISRGVCLFEAGTAVDKASPMVGSNHAVQLVHEIHSHRHGQAAPSDPPSHTAPALPLSHSTAASLLVYLIRRLHNTLWCNHLFVQPQHPTHSSGDSSIDMPGPGFSKDNFNTITRAIIAVLRFPIIRECMDEANVLSTIASILAAQDSATISPSHDCIYLLLEIVILCMTPLSSNVTSVRNQAFLENVDIGALLALDFFRICARFLINVELMTPEITKRLLICFALFSKNSTYKTNCLSALASTETEDISVLAIVERILDDPMHGSDANTIHLVLTIISGFCTDRHFRQSFYSNTSIVMKVAAALSRVLSAAIDLTPVVTAPLNRTTKNVMSSQHVMSVLTAAMNESSAEDDEKEESSSMPVSVRTSMTGSLRDSLRGSLLGASDLKTSDVHFTNSVHIKHSHILGTRSSRRAALDLSRSIHFQDEGEGNLMATTVVTLNLTPIFAHMKVFMAASELISTICVDYGILIDFTKVNFYNPRMSANNALETYAKVLLNSFFPYFIEVAEFLRSLIIVSPAFILEPIMEVVLGALYEISQLDLALVPFLSGQTDIVLLRNKFRLCTKKRMPVLTPMEIRALRCLILFVRNSRIVSLSLFTCALLRKADCCTEIIDSEETIVNTFLAVQHAQAYMDRLKCIHFGTTAKIDINASNKDWTVLKKAATGPICDIATEASILLALLTAESPDVVSSEAAAAVLNLWHCLFVTNPNEMEFVFNSIAYMLKEWPKNRCGSLRGQLGNHSLEKLVDDIWGKRSAHYQ